MAVLCQVSSFRFAPSHRRSLARRRGTILILTLWLTVVLIVMAQSLSYEMQIEMRLASLHRDQFLAEQLARIGVARAICDLRNDRLIDGVEKIESGNVFDALGDVWAAGSVHPYELEIDRMGSTREAGTVDVIVIDEESKLPLNGSGESWRKKMKYLLVMLDVEEEDAKDLADAIGDWSDENDTIETVEAENESEYYTKVMLEKSGDTGRRPHDEAQKVYPKNAPFETVDELLQVPGMTPELFYGYDPEETDEVPFFPMRTIGQRLKSPPGLRDLVTVRTTNVNINTVSFEVLSAICASDSDDLDAGRTAADRIIDQRQGRSEDTIDNNTAFRSLEDIGAVEDLSESLASLIRGAAGDVTLTVQSDIFTIYSRAQTGPPGGKRRSYSSSSPDGPEKPTPTAYIKAVAQRDVLLLEGREYEDMVLPGYSPNAPDSAAVQMGLGQWYVPVAYFRSWNSF